MPRVVRSSGIKGRRSPSRLSRSRSTIPTDFLIRKCTPKFSITITGYNNAKRNFNKVYSNTKSSLYNVINGATKLVADETIKILKSSGEYKAYKTGELAESIKPAMEKFVMDYIYGIVKSDSRYAVYVHYGTKWMKERPFFIIALRRKKKMIHIMAMKAIRKDISKGVFI